MMSKKRKPGPRPKPANERVTVELQFRVTADEARRITAAVGPVESRSQWIRRACLKELDAQQKDAETKQERTNDDSCER
jgi:hypothetical protein